MARYCKFFRGLLSSPSREVSCLAYLLARDIRSSTGANLKFIRSKSGKDKWVDSPIRVRTALLEAEAVPVQDVDKWSLLLEQRMQWHYRGLEQEEKVVQELIDSLCIN